MAKLLDWKNSEDQRDIVHLVVQALVEGRLVALPTETAYHVVCSALNENAVSNVKKLLGERKVDSPSMLLRSAEEAFDYSPGMSCVARRAVYRGWPGPLVLELPIRPSSAQGKHVEEDISLAHRLPNVAKEILLTDDFLAQRVVPHAAIVEAMRLTPGPMIAAPCVNDDGSFISSPTEAEQAVGNECTVLVDDSETHFGGNATRIRVDENQCRILSTGVIEPDKRERLFHLAILLVCTGNTCRSPMAEVLLKDLIKKKFPAQADSGNKLVHVASAGLSAFPGGPASVEAQTVMEKRGLSLRNHQSNALSEHSLKNADLVLTMTSGHRNAILDQLPEYESKIHLLSSGTGDVSDPFGGSESLYAECASQIEEYLQAWLGKLDERWFPVWQNDAS